MNYKGSKPSVFEGEIYTTNKGSSYRVIKYESSLRILIKFEDEHGYEKYVTGVSIRTGMIKNPYAVVYYGVGFLGVGKYTATTRVYYVWMGILNRCYASDKDTNRKSYINCSVNPVWHNFQNFAEWYCNNPYYNDSWELDKDLVVRGNKEYGPDSCAIVPKELNAYAVRLNSILTGVTYDRLRNKYCAKISRYGKLKNLGRFVCEKVATDVYLKAKKEHFRELAFKYDGLVDERIITNLKEWEAST